MSILIQNLTKHYNGRPVLNGFSAEMQKGRPTAVTGPSGCGKTTLLRIIAGLDTEFTGSISGVPDSLSYLFQENRLLPWKTVSDNIAFVVKDILPKSRITEQISRLIQLAHLEGHGGKYPHELSGGMQRRTALCRAFIFPSQILLLDEPFSGLDEAMKHQIADAFLYLAKEMTVIIVTHDDAIIEKCSHVITIPAL